MITPRFISFRALCLALVAFGSLAPGVFAIDPVVVVPNESRDVEGFDLSFLPFSISNIGRASMRYQQLCDASQFASIGRGGWIRQIIFRPDASEFAYAFRSTLPDVQINFSTAAIAEGALSRTFAENIGADETVVYARGPLPLRSRYRGDSPKDFDIVINLTTPFFYKPGDGNLLMDVRIFESGGTAAFDAVQTGGDGVSSCFTNSSDGVDAPTGTVFTLGLVTGFTIRSR